MDLYSNVLNNNCTSARVNVNGTLYLPPANPSLVWLFDLSVDPYENNNLAAVFPDIVRHIDMCVHVW